MIKLYTDDEFKLAKSGDKLKLECEKCHEIIIKEKRAINYGIKGYDGRQNDLCKNCFYVNKIVLLKDICHNCLSEFEYRKSSKKNSEIKLCSKKCNQEHLSKCNKLKREEINKKVSLKLKGKKSPLKGTKLKRTLQINYSFEKCKNCGIEFCNLIGRNKYCGKECLKQFFGSDAHRNKMSNALKGKAGGLRDGGGYSKVYEYININKQKMKLNNSEIKIAKALDNLCLNWNRNINGFKYIDIYGKNRRYYPDFYIKDYDIYVEYKGFITEKMEHKMKDALSKNNFDLLIIYSNNKRYKHLGLNDEQIKNDNNIIIENIIKIKSNRIDKIKMADPS
jgi:hypothetical protein